MYQLRSMLGMIPCCILSVVSVCTIVVKLGKCYNSIFTAIIWKIQFKIIHLLQLLGHLQSPFAFADPFCYGFIFGLFLQHGVHRRWSYFCQSFGGTFTVIFSRLYKCLENIIYIILKHNMSKVRKNNCKLTLQVEMHPDAPYFIFLLCLTPDDCTCLATQWLNWQYTTADE